MLNLCYYKIGDYFRDLWNQTRNNNLNYILEFGKNLNYIFEFGKNNKIVQNGKREGAFECRTTQVLQRLEG